MLLHQATEISRREVCYSGVTMKQSTKKIIDEHTEKPVSRQRKWQLRHPEKQKILNKRNIVHGNITIINLKDASSKKINLYLALKDLKGNILDTKQEELMLNGNMITVSRNLTLPPGTKKDSYIFYAGVS